MTALGDDLLRIVNQLQDLVFNTIGTDSLDLPQIVSLPGDHVPRLTCYAKLAQSLHKSSERPS